MQKEMRETGNSISIGIVSFKSKEDIGVFLDSLKKIHPLVGDYKVSVFVLENAHDGSQEIVDMAVVRDWQMRYHQFFNVSLIANEENLGFGAGHNRILAHVTTPLYYVVNPDIRLIDSNLFFNIDEQFERNQHLSLLSPMILDSDGITQFYNKRHPTVFDMVIRFLPSGFFTKRKNAYVRFPDGYTHSQPIEFASGAFMVVRTSSIEIAGGFDDRFFMYFEDADVSRSLGQIGDTLYFPEVKVEHKWERASRKQVKFFLILILSMIKYFNKWGWKWV
jgi:GT2 family glycosyltransferase